MSAKRGCGAIRKWGRRITLLTVPPGDDIAPYHNRQIALIDPPHWLAWLDGSARSVELLSPSVAGSLSATLKAAASAE